MANVTFIDLFNEIQTSVFPEYDGGMAPNLKPVVRRYTQECLDDLARWIPLLQARNCDVYDRTAVHTDERLTWLPAPEGVVVEVFAIDAEGNPDTRVSFVQSSYAQIIREEERARRGLCENLASPVLPFTEENVCTPFVPDADPQYPAYPSAMTFDLGSGADNFAEGTLSGFEQCDHTRSTQEPYAALRPASYAIELGRIVVDRPIELNEIWKVRWRGRKTRWADMDEIESSGIAVTTAVDLFVRERMARLQDCQQVVADRFMAEYRIQRSNVIRDFNERHLADHPYTR